MTELRAGQHEIVVATCPKCDRSFEYVRMVRGANNPKYCSDTCRKAVIREQKTAYARRVRERAKQ